MSGFDMIDVSFGFISIMEQMLDRHGFCELEIVVFSFGFIMILEQLEEAIGNSRQIRVAMRGASWRLRGARQEKR